MTRSLLRRSVPWFGLGLLLAIAVAMTVYARLGDSYVVTAVTTAPPSEAKSYDLASLSGLASLGGGGQRTTFENSAS